MNSTPAKRSALILVDLQHDFLDRPDVQPAGVVAAAASLLDGFRRAGLPVAHVRTVVRPDGTDAMAHWRAARRLPCVAGTPGAAAPIELTERADEYVATKQHYRGFADPGLDGWLRDRGVSDVVIAGLYTHACVRDTALDAYERGYQVVIAADAIGSDDPVLADATYRWLSTRAAQFRCSAEIVGTLPAPSVPTPLEIVGPAVAAAAAAQARWADRDAADRAALVHRWAVILDSRAEDLARAITADVGKPITQARAEAARAIDHVRTAVDLVDATRDEAVAPGVTARTRPVGVVALIMPWNNPLALPVGKVAAALVLGDAVVLKPAPQGARIAETIVATLTESGVPTGLVSLAIGGADVGATLARADGVDVVAVTGSVETGRSIAVDCARLRRPLQAELGGNNAVVVLADADLASIVPALVRNAFSFAGQRCTAIRRFVVDRSVLAQFTAQVVAAAGALRVGDPDDPDTEVGPLISPAARDRVLAQVGRAVDGGARLLCGGRAPASVVGADATSDLGANLERADLEHAYLEPTVLLVDDHAAEIVRVETFGPVAIIQPADGPADAVAIANAVDQGLVLAVCTAHPAAAAQVLDAAQAGIVQWGADPVPVHPDAPFGGWKASGVGPPEHGRWDAQSLARPQAVYRPPHPPRV